MISTTVQEEEVAFEWPLGSLLALVGKQYAGALSLALEPCGADRYTSILIFLRQCGTAVKQQYIVDHLGIDKASMVRMLDYLVEKDLIRRSVNPQNRREYLLELSTSGKRKLPRIKKEIEKLEDALFRGISLQERKQFYRTLKLVAANSGNIPSRLVSLHFKTQRSKDV